MHKLVGYCTRWSVKQGGRIGFMVSSAGDAPFSLRFTRHYCADPNPNGPGYTEIAMPTALDGTRAGLFQSARLGSSAAVPALAVDPGDGLAVGATLWPTTPAKGVQGVVTIAAAARRKQWRIALCVGAGGGAMAEITGADGAVTRAEIAQPMLERRWYDVALTIDKAGDKAGKLALTQAPRRPAGRQDAPARSEARVAGTLTADLATVTLATIGDAHYNGKLERPTLWRGGITTDAVLGRQRGGVPHAATPGLLACWDFSRDIPGDTAIDVGPAAAHARLIALPTRAMTGASWTGAVHDWKSAPDQYGAIHFHDDDQGDLGWAESFALDIPADWPSGFYSAHISNEAGEDRIPFFVRPRVATSDVAFLVPTFSYQVYGAFVRPGRGAEIAERAAAWGALRETPDMSPEFGLSAYNYHSDGSGVAITSMRRPMLDTRPCQVSLMDPAPEGSGTGRICADSYIIHWLHGLGVEPDVITDHDLHEEGAALLAPYRVVVAGQHPEYHSERMLEALAAFLESGGRMIYLGGNGFYWRAEPSIAAPHAIEIRRAESGIRVWATDPGESYQAYGGGYGGLWRRIGRPAHALVGNGFSVQGKHSGFPYRFTDAIRDPRVAFMTEGIDPAPGAVFGDAGFMGGGAAGFELDSADVRLGTPPHALVVAKGVVIHPDYGPVNEDMLVITHPRPREDWSCADMVFFETPAGGAVFSVGSMTYAGSLPVKGGDTVLGRLTANVLARFRDPAPL